MTIIENINWDIDLVDEIGSTQTYMLKYAKNNINHEGSGLRTLRQFSGKGRQDKKWEGEETENIYFSFILNPNKNIRNIGQLSFVMSVALAKTMSHFISEPNVISLKWPNDILLHNKKVSGILLDIAVSNNNIVNSIVIGIGINIKSAPAKASCLSEYNNNISNTDFLELLLTNISTYYKSWLINGFNDIRKEWLNYCNMMGKKITVTTVNEKFDAIAQSLDENGCLHLYDENKQINRIISSGEIFFKNEQGITPLV